MLQYLIYRKIDFPLQIAMCMRELFQPSEANNLKLLSICIFSMLYKNSNLNVKKLVYCIYWLLSFVW